MFFFLSEEGGGGGGGEILSISSYPSSIASLPPPTNYKRDFCHAVV